MSFYGSIANAVSCRFALLQTVGGRVAVSKIQSLSSAFGCELRLSGDGHGMSIGERLERAGVDLPAIVRSYDLVVLRGATSIRDNPVGLIELGKLIGRPLDSRVAGVPENFLLRGLPEIFVNSNLPPSNRLPPAQDAVITDNSAKPNQYPNKQGWHHDQSFIAKPPALSILYGHTTTPSGGETLYANSRLALRNATGAMLEQLFRDRTGVHAVAGFGRTEREVKQNASIAGRPIVSEHRLVARCPLTGADTIFLSDGIQMDFLDGPFRELSRGPDGEGALLMRNVISYVTEPSNVYVHRWQPDDIVLHNNYCVIHAATWYDYLNCPRVMWRVTVSLD